MSPYLILAHIATLVWIFPPFKQRGTKYFYFFLVYALSGPTMLLSAWVFKIQFNYLYLAIYLLLLASLMSSKKRIIVFCLALVSLVLCPMFKPNNVLFFGITTAVDLVVFLIFLLTLFEQFAKTYTINLLLVLLFIYTAIDIVKLFDIAININLGYVYYYFGVATQIFFGVSFWFINENTKIYKINIKGFEGSDT